jgi:hypothetical protein
VPRIPRKASGPGVLTTGALTAWALALGLQFWGDAAALATTFAGIGFVLVLTRAFYSRVYGSTKFNKDGVETTIAPDVSVSSKAPEAQQPPVEASPDASTLSARAPTLESALNTVPLSWTKERICHEDGQDYVHVKSPQGGFDVVINVAALDSPAPRWLLVAISAMESSERD